MSEPFLIPCPTEVLAPGLRIYTDVVDTRIRVCMFVDTGKVSEKTRVTYAIMDEQNDEQEWGRTRNPRIDVRDPHSRDRLCRALWAKLRPGEAEPLTAPRWFHADGCAGSAWFLVREAWVFDRRDLYDPETDYTPDECGFVFVEDSEDDALAWERTDTEVRVIPALADVLEAGHAAAHAEGRQHTHAVALDHPDRDLLALAEVCKAVFGV